jgi:hypothetical protein
MSTTNTLAPISPSAEKALFGQPNFTVIDTATAGALDAVATPPANSNKQARMKYLTLSYSAAPAVSTLTVEDGSTVIWQAQIPADAGPYTFDFSEAPLRSTVNTALHAKVGSAGGAVVQAISWIGDFVAGP